MSPATSEMPYKEGQPKEEAVIQLGTGNHILVHWFNTYFNFFPEGGLIITNEDAKVLFEGDELGLIEALQGRAGA